MSATWPKVRLSEVVRDLTPVRTIQVYDDDTIVDPTISSATHTILVASRSRGFEVKVRKRVRIEPGDLVFSRLHTQNGAFAFSGETFQATGTFIPLEINETRADRRFLFWALYQFVPSLSASDTVGRETFKTDEILALKIPLPPLTEQRRVVARIDELAAQIHEARALRSQAADEAEALVSAEMRRVFDFGDASQTNVGDYARVQGGYAFPSSGYDEQGSHQVVRIGNVRDGYLDLSRAPVRWNPVGDERVMRYELQPGDIVISMTGTRDKRDYGFVARVPEGVPLLLNQRIGRFVLQREVEADYLFQFLRSPFFRDRLFPSATGTANQANVGNGDIERVPFTPPPLSEQRRIVAQLDALQAQVDALKRLQAETAPELDALLPSILDRTFKGEL
jgi:type I restriction enzyme S subunit